MADSGDLDLISSHSLQSDSSLLSINNNPVGMSQLGETDESTGNGLRIQKGTSSLIAQKSVASEELDSDDQYISSGDEILETLGNPENQHRHLTYGSGLAQHTAFFEKSLSEALDLVSLDSSLALQAQLSGQLNDKAKFLLDKKAQILTRLDTLKALYKQYIGENKLGDLEHDIQMVSSRIARLKHGHSKSTLFRKKRSLGVVDQFPIEYNQARDKVIERPSN